MKAKNTTGSTDKKNNDIVSSKEIFPEGAGGAPEFQHGDPGPPPAPDTPYDPEPFPYEPPPER